jgi:hypothetical protein
LGEAGRIRAEELCDPPRQQPRPPSPLPSVRALPCSGHGSVGYGRLTEAQCMTVLKDTAEITATWTTKGGVAIIGELELQQLVDGDWEGVSTLTTAADSTAEAEVDASVGDRFRFVYEGGSRFDAVESDDAVVIGEDVRTIPVTTCQNGTDIDNLPYGAACHYEPVSVDTFVVAHDYLGNAWWNAMPMGTIVELEGRKAGVYEVVDRTIAPGRGSALGAASNWACGDACDVILQTCQGSNTGFTWLRKID